MQIRLIGRNTLLIFRISPKVHSPGDIPAELSPERIDCMLRDCFLHAGLVAVNELSKAVDIIIVHIDPSDSQFFWAMIAEEPYVSTSPDACLIWHYICCVCAYFVTYIRLCIPSFSG